MIDPERLALMLSEKDAKLKIAEDALEKVLVSSATDPSKCGNEFYANECRRVRYTAKEALEKLRAKEGR